MRWNSSLQQILFFASTLHLLQVSIAQQVHFVSVGRNESGLALRFFPEVITAAVGDAVQFQFYPLNHSVVQSLPDEPCKPMPSPYGFFSGFMPIAASDVVIPSFTIQIQSTEPMFFYCSQGRHCHNGMVGVINPNSDWSLEDYRELAARDDLSRSESPTVTAGTGQPVQSNVANREERVVNVGAIVGGILGGVAVLVLAVVGFGTWVIKKKGGFGKPEPGVNVEDGRGGVLPGGFSEGSQREWDTELSGEGVIELEGNRGAELPGTDRTIKEKYAG